MHHTFDTVPLITNQQLNLFNRTCGFELKFIVLQLAKLVKFQYSIHRYIPH